MEISKPEYVGVHGLHWELDVLHLASGGYGRDIIKLWSRADYLCIPRGCWPSGLPGPLGERPEMGSCGKLFSLSTSHFT